MEQLRRRGDPEGMLEELSEDAPPLVVHVHCLEQDLKALLEPTDPLIPPYRVVRSNHLQVCYVLGKKWRRFWKYHNSGWARGVGVGILEGILQNIFCQLAGVRKPGTASVCFLQGPPWGCSRSLHVHIHLCHGVCLIQRDLLKSHPVWGFVSASWSSIMDGRST
jgi:hypothetical protein